MKFLSNKSARLLAGVLAVSSLAFVAAACGGDDDADADPTSIPSGGTLLPANTNTVAASSPSAAASASASTSPAASASAAASPSGSATVAASPTAVTTAASIQVTSGRLTNEAGFTLYTWDTDTTVGKSVCNGGCAATWPPLLTTATATAPTVSGATGAFTVITRDDGSKQVAYKDKPLYLYRNDTAAGQTTGDGVGGTWHIAVP